MAKQKTDETATATQETPAPVVEEKAPTYRVLVNPSGNLVQFNLNDPAYDYFLCLQRPPGVKPAAWYREPTVEELAAFVKANPY